MVETNKHAIAHLLLTYFTDQGEEARSPTSVQLAHIWYQWGKESETLEILLGYLTVQAARFLAMGIFQISVTELIFVSQHRTV